MRRALALAGLLALLAGGRPAPVRADVSSEARTPWEVYERRQDVAETLLYVVRDLKVRHDQAPEAGPATLLLLVDPTPSLVDEIEVLADTLKQAWTEGPAGLRVGVQGVGAETFAPTGIRREAESALLALAYLPVGGPKNLLAAVREASRTLGAAGGGPRSLLLVTGEGGDGEDDVEATRERLMDDGVSFYALAPEAAFERAWRLDFEPQEVPELGLTERFDPEPRRRADGELYYGGDVAFGLVPYRYELDLAQTEFVWLRPPRWPVPSGFGYWCLATLAYSTGGRYFVHDFTLPPRRAPPAEGAAARRTTLYDYSRLALFVPDLRPRRRILKDLAHDPRARAIVRIWTYLADEATPVIEVLGQLEERGGGLVTRPGRAIRSKVPAPGWMESMKDVRRAQDLALDRIAAVDQALRWWAAANAKPRTPPEQPDPLLERVDADFQLLGIQLRKVRFHWQGFLAALGEVKPLHVTDRRVRLRPRVIAAGFERRPGADDLGDPERNADLAEIWLAMEQARDRYRDTPWSYVLERGHLATFEIDVQVIEPPGPEAPRPPDRGKPGPGGEAAPSAPKPPPANGPRPGSTTGGPTTGR